MTSRDIEDLARFELNSAPLRQLTEIFHAIFRLSTFRQGNSIYRSFATEIIRCPMTRMVLRIFQGEVAKQCKFAMIAVNQMNLALKASDVDWIFSSIQSFLVAWANISKLLWPAAPRTRKCPSCGVKLPVSPPLLPRRGIELRASLNVPSNSPLKSRALRNHFEHFDERIEKWAVSSRRHNFADTNVGPLTMISGLDPDDYMRNFDPTTSTVTFRGQSFSLQSVIAELRKLCPVATAEAQKPYV